MKKTHKTLIAVAVATALTAAAGTAVFAHGGGYGPGYGSGARYGQMMGGPGMMGGYGQMMGGGRAMMGGPRGMMFDDHAAHAEQRLENFRTELNITEEQEDVWKGFADALRAQAAAMNARHQAMAGGKEFGFAERFAQMEAGAAQREAVAGAAQALYAALSPEQQARADALTAGGCRR